MAEVTVPCPTAGPGTLLGVAWGPGNCLALHTRGPRGQQGGQGVRGATVQEVRWETTLFEPVYRKLVNESLGVFLGLQRLVEEEATPGPQELVRVSRQYRSVIKDCQEQLEELAERGQAGQSAHYSAQSELLYKLELVWHLLEILYLESSPGGLVLPLLLTWVARHFPGCEERARSVLSLGSDSPEQHGDYWEAVTQFVLQGRLEEARNLLRLHTEFSTDPFTSLDELLRKMPQSSAASSAADFEFRHGAWQVEVTARLQEGDFAAFPELTAVAELLAGQEAALHRVTSCFLLLIKNAASLTCFLLRCFPDLMLPTPTPDPHLQAADQCETWYEWLVARLLYSLPTVKTYDLGVHGQQAVDRFGGLSSMTTLDSVLLAALESDIPQVTPTPVSGHLPQVMRELCLTLDNFWLPAHLLDLLQTAGALGQGEGGLGAGLREFLVLDYATALCSHHSLWQVSMHCDQAKSPRTLPFKHESKSVQRCGTISHQRLIKSRIKINQKCIQILKHLEIT